MGTRINVYKCIENGCWTLPTHVGICGTTYFTLTSCEMNELRQGDAIQTPNSYVSDRSTIPFTVFILFHQVCRFVDPSLSVTISECCGLLSKVNTSDHTYQTYTYRISHTIETWSHRIPPPIRVPYYQWSGFERWNKATGTHSHHLFGPKCQSFIRDKAIAGGPEKQLSYPWVPRNGSQSLTWSRGGLVWREHCGLFL